MDKIDISIVSYLNSRLFVFGLNNYPHIKNLIEIHTDVPSVCAEKVLRGEVSIGLIPSASLVENENLNVFSNYCLSSNSKVQSVLLASNCDIKDIKKVYLDSDSKTSVNLTKVLAKNHWEILPKWIHTSNIESKEIAKNEAVVIIGDKVFQLKDKFKYHYDLAEEWFKLTNRPFVFAVWASNAHIDKTFEAVFNAALKYGLDKKDIVIHQVSRHYPSLSVSKIAQYLTKNMSFDFSEDKKESLKLFLNYLRNL